MVRLCGYLPLAIRLVAGRVAAHPSWTPNDVMRNLAEAENRLTQMRVENVTVAAAFALSYRGLSIRQRQLFRRLGMHPGSDVDVYAAAALDGSDPAQTQRNLEEIYDQHLVDEPACGRFRFHDLIREYARALAERDRTDKGGAVNRLLNFYLGAATIADSSLREASADTPYETTTREASAMPDLSSYASALTWLETERLNITSAINYAAAHGQSEIAAQLGHAIAFFMLHRGYWDQALALHLTTLEAATASCKSSNLAVVLKDLGILQWRKGNYTEATAALTKALGLYTDLDDQQGRADTLHHLGIVQGLVGDHMAGAATITKALADFRGRGACAALARMWKTLLDSPQTRPVPHQVS